MEDGRDGGDDASSGPELYRTDGTAAGTTLVSDLGGAQLNKVGRCLAVTGGAVWFTAWSGATGIELWRSDLLASSPAVAAPTTLLMVPGSSPWLDPLTFQLEAILAGPSYAYVVPVPANPGLAGLVRHVQAFTPAPVAPLALVASDVVKLTLGL